jgi:AcrR family transcriptional regulator
MRKTKEEAQKTRNEILKAAANLFETAGFERSTMEQIASEAGVTRGAIYWHFKNKLEVLESIVSAQGENLQELIKHSLAGGSALERLKRLIFAVIDNFYDNESFRQFIKITWYKLSSDEFEKLTLEKSVFVQDFLVLMEKLIREAQAAGEVRKNLDPGLQAYHLSCLINGFYRVYLVSPQHGQEKEKTTKLFAATFKQMQNRD